MGLGKWWFVSGVRGGLKWRQVNGVKKKESNRNDCITTYNIRWSATPSLQEADRRDLLPQSSSGQTRRQMDRRTNEIRVESPPSTPNKSTLWAVVSRSERAESREWGFGEAVLIIGNKVTYTRGSRNWLFNFGVLVTTQDLSRVRILTLNQIILKIFVVFLRAGWHLRKNRIVFNQINKTHNS
jgi:hypothetical protein